MMFPISILFYFKLNRCFTLGETLSCGLTVSIIFLWCFNLNS